MKKIIALVVYLSLTVVANAADLSLEFYFSKQGDLSGIPSEYTNKIIPTADVGEKAYLWAYVEDAASRWTLLSLFFGGPVCTSGMMYNPLTTDPVTHQVVWQRWSPSSDVYPVGVGDNSVTCVVSSPPGPVTGLGDSAQDTKTVGTTRHFLLGEMDFGSPGPVYLTVGYLGILKEGTSCPPTDHIYFGFTAPSPGVPEPIQKLDGTPACGADIDATTPTPDLNILPEPASLLLLGVAGLVIRRRR